MLDLLRTVDKEIIVVSKNIDGINLQEFAKKRTTKTDVLYAKRGSIYDVNENVLAQNVSSYTVIAYLDPSRTTNPENPKHVVDKEYTAKKLSEILDMDYDKTLAYLSKENVYQTELGNKAKGKVVFVIDGGVVCRIVDTGVEKNLNIIDSDLQ